MSTKPLPLHILFLYQTLDIGGAEVFNADLLEALKKKGNTVSVATTHPRFASLLEKKGIASTHLPIIIDIVGDWKGLIKGIAFSPFAFLQYWQVLWRNRFADVILVTGYIEKIIVTPLATLLHIPVVWVEFGPITPLFLKFLGMPKYLYLAVSSLPTKVIVPSKHTYGDVVRYVQKQKLIVIPCGRFISDHFFHIHKIKSLKKNIVCVSRLEPGKGQDLLIQAFALVHQRFPNVDLHITGEGNWRLNLEHITAELHLESCLHFVGRVESSLQLMGQADICVFPSVWDLEGFGLVTIEAMALGKPIVAFATGPVPEIIHDRRNGLLAIKGDVHDLANKMMMLLSSTSLSMQLGKQARSDFLKYYQIEMVAMRYNSVLHQAVISKTVS